MPTTMPTKGLRSDISIVDAMNHPSLFGQWFPGDSWNGWRSILKAAYCLPMSPDEVSFFRSVAGGRDVPKQRLKEVWVAAGRRGGKSAVASLIIAHSAALFDPQYRLRPGEKACCLCLGVDRAQAQVILQYVKSYFQNIPPFAELVVNERLDGLELSNGCDIVIQTSNYKSLRGRTVLVACLDELAFHHQEETSRPDVETYAAITPAMATLPNSMLVAISTPYARKGLLYQKWKSLYGKDDPPAVCIQASTAQLNSTIDPAIVAAALEDDPASASAEWLGQFRTDISGFIIMEMLDAVTDKGVIVRSPQPGVRYVGFVDSSSGSGKDSFACCIAHGEKDRPILDLAHETRPPFSPTQAIEHISILLKSYRVHTVVGDKYAPGFVVEGFARCGIKYLFSEFDRSEIYLECLPLLTSGRAKLLDIKRLLAQFASLERRTLSTGKDRVDHPAGDRHDDLSNSCAGVLRLVGSGPKTCRVSPEFLDALRSGRRGPLSRGSHETVYARQLRENRERGWGSPEDEDAA
jgi:hypothetical protein